MKRRIAETLKRRNQSGGATSVALMAILLACSTIIQTASAAPPRDFNYIRKDTRAASRDATLEQYMPALTLSDWNVIGPFDNTGRDKHDVVYPPEINIDLDASYQGKGGQRVAWQPIPDDEWSRIDLVRFGSNANNTDSIAYIYRTFEAKQDTTLHFEMGSDDGLKVWFNGHVVVDADVYRGMNIQDHNIAIPIRAGTNEILVKVTQGVASWEFQMQPNLDTRLLALLEYHLNQDFPRSREFEHYLPLSVLEPKDVVLEVGGLDVMPDGRPIVATRRGEVWVIDGAYDDPPFDAKFTRFAFGLHEPLGGVWHDGGYETVQRGELTKLIDTSTNAETSKRRNAEMGDGSRESDSDFSVSAFPTADIYQTISSAWGVSGNYHEFAFGPEFDGQGRRWVTLNVGFCGSLGKSLVPWRGWAVIIDDDGSLTPVCGGLRSPNGLGRNAEGDMFCCDNQGDWVGTNKMMHLDFGDWHGHPAGDKWYEEAGMRQPTGEADFKPPAIWFPYDRMGRSASDILLDDTGGKFGPFEGQLFVGDQYAATLMRVSLERIDGVYQGACYPFLSGLDSGVNRMCWGNDGSMFVGMTNRGWWSFGSRAWGVQRVVYTGKLPFEVREMRAAPDGFELEFTKPIDRERAADSKSYRMASFTHHRWETYGSPEIDRSNLAINEVQVAGDGLSVRLKVTGLRPRYVHEIELTGIRSADGEELLHDMAYYTLNVIPNAETSKAETPRSGVAAAKSMSAIGVDGE